MKTPESEWTPQDLFIGALLALFGTLLSAFVFQVFGNLGKPVDDPRAVASAVSLVVIGVVGCVMGPLLVLLGGNTMFQGIRAMVRRRDRS